MQNFFYIFPGLKVKISCLSFHNEYFYLSKIISVLKQFIITKAGISWFSPEMTFLHSKFIKVFRKHTNHWLNSYFCFSFLSKKKYLIGQLNHFHSYRSPSFWTKFRSYRQSAMQNLCIWDLKFNLIWSDRIFLTLFPLGFVIPWWW